MGTLTVSFWPKPIVLKKSRKNKRAMLFIFWKCVCPQRSVCLTVIDLPSMTSVNAYIGTRVEVVWAEDNCFYHRGSDKFSTRKSDIQSILMQWKFYVHLCLLRSRKQKYSYQSLILAISWGIIFLVAIIFGRKEIASL